VDALIQQDGPHLRRRLIDEPVTVQDRDDGRAFGTGQRAGLGPVSLVYRGRSGRDRR
jgi:hypothetical protein